jgi:protein phosphatase 1 regulatory subunit 7
MEEPAPVSVDSSGPNTVVWIDSTRVAECVELAASIGAKYVGISPHHGYSSRDLSFLASYPEITGLSIPFASAFDLTPLKTLTNLRHLILGESVVELDTGWFPSLQELRTDWHDRLVIDACSRLTTLFLMGSGRRGADLAKLPRLPSLKELEIIQSRFPSLDGIDRFPELSHLELHYIQGLRDGSSICALSKTLSTVFFSHVRGGIDLTLLRCLKTLERLRLNQCGTLPSIAFLNELPSLREFRFVQTIVEDGDLSPLLRLDAVGFFDRRGYSHKSKEIDRVIAERRARGGAS